MNEFGLLARLAYFLRLVLPGVFSLLLIIVGPVPVAAVFGTGAITPSFVVPLLYFWSMFRPDLVPAIILILFAMIEDAITGRPIGVGAVIAISVLFVIRTQEQVFRLAPAGYLWAGFGMVTVVAGFTGWLVMAIYHWDALPVWPVIVQGLLLIGLYPAIAAFLHGLVRIAPRARP